MPFAASAGMIGRVPPVRSEQRTAAHDPLEGVLRELDRRRVRRDQPRGARRPALDVELRAVGHGLAQEALERRGDPLEVLPGREPDRDVRVRLDREDGLLEVGLAAVDAVHVHGGPGERPQVELLGRPRVQRPRSVAGEDGLPGLELLPGRQLLLCGCDGAGTQLVRDGHDGGEHLQPARAPR